MLPPAILCAFAVAISPASYAARNNNTPGQVWNDTSGRHINAHGGCVQYLDGTYYWFGEKTARATTATASAATPPRPLQLEPQRTGVQSIANHRPRNRQMHRSNVESDIQRQYRKWVMYITGRTATLGEARVCVAVADKIDGDYQFVSTFRPNNHDSRDQTVFKDTMARHTTSRRPT